MWNLKTFSSTKCRVVILKMALKMGSATLLSTAVLLVPESIMELAKVFYK